MPDPKSTISSEHVSHSKLQSILSTIRSSTATWNLPHHLHSYLGQTGTLIHNLRDSAFSEQCLIYGDKTITYIKAHPYQSAFIATRCILLITPLAPLATVGFGILGPIGGTAAAGWQSWYGDVPAGSVFSVLESWGMKYQEMGSAVVKGALFIPEAGKVMKEVVAQGGEKAWGVTKRGFGAISSSTSGGKEAGNAVSAGLGKVGAGIGFCARIGLETGKAGWDSVAGKMSNAPVKSWSDTVYGSVKSGGSEAGRWAKAGYRGVTGWWSK